MTLRSLPELPGVRLDERLYLGSKTVVYRGHHAELDRPVAVKLHRDAFPSDRQVASQRRAMELGARVAGSPRIVTHLGLIPHGNDLALVMEDIGGPSLDRLIAEHGALPVRRALQLGLAVAEGLATLHEAGIVHKDIKPANVVIGADDDTVKLIDLGIASTLRSDAADRVEGTLRYASPEQTGRTRRGVDARSDLYSLGATLYHLLAGRPPFDTDDALELVHAHIAVAPPPLHAPGGPVPRMVAELVTRLLAKSPDDRYQTAAGVVHDLKRCLESLEALGTVPPFHLGAADRSARFALPDRLYGRGPEQHALQDAFDGVRVGGVELLLVAGRSGIGKSALVGRVQPHVVAAHGWFAGGKFDQFRRDIPYLGWVGALQDLLRQALALDEASLAGLRERLSHALGDNGAVIAEVVPELAGLLGPQPAVVDVSPTDAQARFRTLFRRFVGVFADAEQPLVLFVDDLQWADLPSLALLEALVTDPDASGLLVLGAWRNEEVGPGHPLTATLERIHDAGVVSRTLTLGPLGRADVRQLVADTVHAEPDTVVALADLVHDRTGGNPFFVRQLLEQLARDELVRFDHEAGAWRWDLAAIQARGLTEDVAALMSERLHSLPPDGRRALQVAACVGSRFRLGLVAEVLEQPRDAVARALEAALDAELVLPLDEDWKFATVTVDVDAAYRFLHDRVEEAAHESLSDEERARLHLCLARLLQAREEVDEVHVAAHLAEALPLLEGQEERTQAARVFLRAARRAKASMAMPAARHFLEDGRGLLAPDAWQTEHPLAMGLFTESADVAYVEGRFDDVEALAPVVLEHARGVLERVPVHLIRIGVGVAQLRYRDATWLAVDVLKQDYGLSLPKDPSMAHVVAGLLRLKLAVGSRSTDDLLALPPLQDPEIEAALGILMKTATNAYWGVPNLVPLIAFRMIRLSIQHGQTALSAYGYALYGMIASAALGRIDEGYAYGQLAMDVLDRTGATHLIGKTGLLWHGFIRHQKDDYRTCAAETLACYHHAMDAGDVENAVYCGTVAWYTDLLSGRSLSWLEDRYADYLPALLASGQEQTIYALQVWRMAAERLGDASTTDGHLHGDAFDFEERLAALQAAEGEGQAIAQGTSAAGWLAFVMGDLDRAAHMLGLMDDHREAAPGQTFLAPCQALLAVCLTRTGADPRRLSRLARELKARGARHADLAPYQAWLQAEATWASRGPRVAMPDLLDAASLARGRGNLWLEALISDRAGALHSELGHLDLARNMARHSRALWRRFGAVALGGEVGGPNLSTMNVTATTTHLSAAGSDGLSTVDVQAMLAAVRAISGEIELGRLVTRVLTLAVQAAGARRGLLLLRSEDEDRDGLELVAEARVVGEQIRVQTGTELEGEPVPDGMVAYVHRTGRPLLLDDATTDERFTRGGYARAHGIRSVCCLPLSSQGAPVGVLYLDHELERGVFTPAHLDVLTTLGGQAAVAVVNARLYEAQRRAAEAFARFVPRPFLEHLGRRRIEDVVLGDASETPLSVLFSDLRQFTGLSEQLDAARTFALLNAYLARMEPAIQRHGGFIDKYIGDAVMALFARDADGAVAAGIEMHRALSTFNRESEREGRPPLAMGIGIHTGPAMLGTIGSPARMETTVIGDTVNLASRLEGTTKDFHAPMLISEQTRLALSHPERIALRQVGRVRVKGRREAVSVHEVLDARDPKQAQLLLETRTAFEQALEYWVAAEFVRATRGFEQCAAQAPFDRLAVTLAERSRALARDGTPAEWDGVEVRETK